MPQGHKLPGKPRVHPTLLFPALNAKPEADVDSPPTFVITKRETVTKYTSLDA